MKHLCTGHYSDNNGILYICNKEQCCCIKEYFKVNAEKQKKQKNNLYFNPRPRLVLLRPFYRDQLFLLVIL